MVFLGIISPFSYGASHRPLVLLNLKFECVKIAEVIYVLDWVVKEVGGWSLSKICKVIYVLVGLVEDTGVS